MFVELTVLRFIPFCIQFVCLFVLVDLAATSGPDSTLITRQGRSLTVRVIVCLILI